MTDPSRPMSATTIAALVADTSPYLSCDECFDRIDEHVERRITEIGYDDVAMRTHLAGCGACAEEEQTLRELLTSYPDPTR